MGAERPIPLAFGRGMKANLWGPRALVRRAKDKGILPHKGLGQHFLLDKGIALRIAEAAGVGGEDVVLEIGPGVGSLTFALAEKAKKVVAVEVDKRLVEFLKEETAGLNVEILEGDILEVDLPSLASMEGEMKVVANLPYNLSTRILFYLLEHRSSLKDLTLMFQREVAERIVSPPGSKNYGVLSVMARLWAEPKMVMRVPKGAFWPPPEVEGAVVYFKLRKEREVHDVKAVRRIVEAAFSTRRKTLLNALSAAGIAPKEKIREILLQCGIDPMRRAETLTLEELIRLTEATEEA